MGIPYDFTRTGVAPIDDILTAIEEAGRCAWNMDYWGDEFACPEEGEPSCPGELVQYAAERAAEVFRSRCRPHRGS